MRNLLWSFVSITAALGGCADGARLSTLPTITRYYDPTLDATRDGGMPTVIHGNPFALPQTAADEHVLASLELPSRFESAPFKRLPVDSAPRGYRLVLVFNAGPPWIGFQDACGDL